MTNPRWLKEDKEEVTEDCDCRNTDLNGCIDECFSAAALQRAHKHIDELRPLLRESLDGAVGAKVGKCSCVVCTACRLLDRQEPPE